MSEIEDTLRELAPQVLASLMRRFGQFDACEDAVQEALLAAALQWPKEGIPANPHGWLVTVASRRLVDWFRSDTARRQREENDALLEPPAAEAPDHDDTLTLLFLCCHPSLSPPSQIALTLRAVGGLSTAEIAKAFFVPEATMAQRISRAKKTIAGTSFTLPDPSERPERLRAVLHVLYLMFNEGYTATAGPDLQRRDLTRDAVRLARLLHAILPGEHEVAGLLALILLTDARRDARVSATGELIALSEQDRSRWDKALIAEGVELLTATLKPGELGPYQVQAAIAALHDEAERAEDTDWPQILALYGLLEQDNPMVTLNRAVAVAMVQGPQSGLDILSALEADERMAKHHRLHAVRGHLLEMAGRPKEARASYLAAATFTTSLPEQNYLRHKAATLG